MATERLILDIRYYESDQPNADGGPLPGGPGRVFQFPKSIHALGARIARKLRELGFVAGDFDHLYLNFTPALPALDARWSARVIDGRIRYIDYGLSPEAINGQAEAEKERIALNATLNALGLVCERTGRGRETIERVRREIEEHGSELEIVDKTKDSKTFAVTVTYKIRPGGGRSVGLLSYTDKTSGRSFKKVFIELLQYEDIFALVGSISVSGGVVRLSPRSSLKADLTTQRYTVPIEVPLAEQSAA